MWTKRIKSDILTFFILNVPGLSDQPEKETELAMPMPQALALVCCGIPLRPKITGPVMKPKRPLGFEEHFFNMIS